MKNYRAFVFSVDAFVAFSLALIVIYSLIFFSSVPSAYYSSLMQAHYLAKDVLVALSESKVPDIPGLNPDMSKLDYIAIYSSSGSGAVKDFVGPLIPNQFGYKIEINDGIHDWEKVYDTADHPDESHKKSYAKLKVSAQMVTFEYASGPTSPSSPYSYISCGGDFNQCGEVILQYSKSTAKMRIVRLTVYT